MSSVAETSRTNQVGARRRAREFCLALIFAADVGRQPPVRILDRAEALLDTLMALWDLNAREAAKLGTEIQDYGRALAEQYFAHAREVDELISSYSEGWAVSRMPAVDRNLLRMALAEMLYEPEVPVGVTIDEAVELAKEYGTEESGKFINGILGAVARQIEAEEAG